MRIAAAIGCAEYRSAAAARLRISASEYSDTETAVYPITITAQAGSDGDTHKEYIKRASST